ncbi:SagB family peptide dehydrogenase [Bacillus sp. ISL-35]|uniref:SagB family peptide dehydrogenase n=1 Tax=Bacillus sp. ISL-35 TaxID=2819122 RepID=UPI001BE7EF60|nr:SagB family peptide dehydrogenase [Bacillus sp. ISL-35]MBT2681783.1 SagB family peptide dehydrogenase [Bacillus sp. ISL-35]MBT2706080.1 SagB family peptide dehydrogenase [Chryseobacterium sp. ISL-80]
MTLDEFLKDLHFDIDRANQENWEPNWEDAPLAYKLYKGLPVVPLSAEVPLSLEEYRMPASPDLKGIGHFLWYVFGISQLSESVFPEEANPIHSYRRFAPSGGALYPNELYVYLKINGLPDGVYHYDPSHHRLVLLRAGNFDSYISAALGERCELSSCFGTVFISTMFWKNFFKYNNFSYRLQGLDAGVLMGQLLESAKRFGFAAGVYYQYLDSALNHLLGLSEQEESIYSVIPLSVEPTNWTGSGIGTHITADTLKKELKPVVFERVERSKNVLEFHKLIEMNDAAKFESTASFTRLRNRSYEDRRNRVIHLPQTESLPYDLAEVSKKRFSPEMDFVLSRISQEQLAVLLKESLTSFHYRNDVDDIFFGQEPKVSVYSCLYNVEGIPNGAYHYDSREHRLLEIQQGDHRLLLQSGLSFDNVNLQQVPLCLHVAGNMEFYQKELGYRGYRILQMEAGMLVQRLLLTSSALGLGGHPLLGFNASMADQLYEMSEQTSLIRIPIGNFRPRPWLKGSLHS